MNIIHDQDFDELCEDKIKNVGTLQSLLFLFYLFVICVLMFMLFFDIVHTEFVVALVDCVYCMQHVICFVSHFMYFV